MSYDLFFLRRRSEAPLSIDAFRTHFAEREHYSIAGDGRDQAVYENRNTGVYFAFEHASPDEDREELDEVDDDFEHTGVSFNLNYWRPSIFGLEAEPEVRVFVDRFGLHVDDPQTDGMGRGPYSSALFLTGWNAGNEFAYRALRGEVDEPPASLPTAEIHRCWSWNRRIPELQQELGDDVFVPTISFVRHNGRVASYVVWGDALPIALPRTDLVVLARRDLGRRRFLSRPQLSASWVPRESVDDLATFGRAEEDHVVFGYREPPEAIVTRFLDAPETDDAHFERITVDEILDAELLAEAADA